MTYKRVEHLAEGVTLYQGDMMDVLPTLGRFDACVTDPPYGIGADIGVGRSDKAKIKAGGSANIAWDSAPASQDSIGWLMGISLFQIIWGGNYFDLPPTRCVLSWDKNNAGRDFADFELAWTNLDRVARRIVYRPQNMDGGKEHPTQKPIEVMAWCIDQLPKTVSTIIDPFMGSGTTGVAAVKRGKCFTGIEREAKYFDIACRRIEAALKAPDMFVAPRVVPVKQEGFL